MLIIKSISTNIFALLEKINDEIQLFLYCDLSEQTFYLNRK